MASAFMAGIVNAAGPVARWDFSAEEVTRLVPHGSVQRDVPGPRPPEFPDLDPGNTAVKLDGNGSYFSFADPGPGSPFDFKNGDAVTLEAWVKVDNLRPGENVYVIGKGRTGAPGFAEDNQNWALRLRESKGRAAVSILFATPVASGAPRSEAHWHRWTTTTGFSPTSGWHHVAVAYRFGETNSIRAWIDGQRSDGAWDMGGATSDAPVVDDDEVWIGSSRGGAPANSFHGSLDAIAIHREILSDEAMRSRFKKTGMQTQAKPAPETMPEVGPIPPGKVLITYHENYPTHDRWLNEGESVAAPTASVTGDSFLVTRVPLRFDDWGIRDAWKAPVLARISADVVLPPGKQRLMLRARALGRVWVNGSVVLRTAALVKSPPDGEEPITPVVPPPLPGVRSAAYFQQEVFADVDVPAVGRCRVVLETVLGGKKLRVETSELLVAALSPDGRSYHVLTPVGRADALPLTDDAISKERVRIEEALVRFDDDKRRLAARSHEEFWKMRHGVAAEWVRRNPTPSVPTNVPHPVDAFIEQKIERALAEAAKTPEAEARNFHSTILPILRDECFRCHGEKEKGGLRLNSRAALLTAGDSGKAAVVPGSPEASQLIARIRSHDEEERMPPKGDGLKQEQIRMLEDWVKAGAKWPAPPLSPTDVSRSVEIDDAAFLRRIHLDLVGVPPTEAEARAFLADPSPDKRDAAIDRLLADERWTDQWMGYWLDVLAENPTLLNPTLNSTGPFRWFLRDALRDNKPFDRLVTELILLRGSASEGGSAGFGLAGENDAPFAAKGHIIGTAFLGIELQCARCHDSPYHSTKQRDLYALAAMFERKPVTVPKTSTVPAAFFEKKSRESLIRVTLKPGEPVEPRWPFSPVTGSPDEPSLDRLVRDPKDTRERLAALITGPQNTRFAQVIVNRVWRRFMGAGFVEPVHDWEGHPPSHPELLDWLAGDFVAHGYDLKHLARRIVTSRTYRLAAVGNNLAAASDVRFFNAPERRRLSAEQIVDSLHAASGHPMDVEEMTFDPTGRRADGARITLGLPKRAWMFGNLANERDRPSLSLPRGRAVADVLEAFGWNAVRQTPRTDRETDPNVLQPGVLANGILSTAIVRASPGSGLAELAVNSPAPGALLESVFLRFLNRPPTEAESTRLLPALADGFAQRLVPPTKIASPGTPAELPRVTWFNHLQPEATTLALELEKRVRQGPPPDPRLEPRWRESYEDVVWSVVNSPEFVWMP